MCHCLPALVLELVEGEDLAQRIARGPIPLDEALPIARQIADALEAAHEQGIIHRDLKPANIKMRPDGTVKVLDFGLAKATDPAGTSSANAMNSPTLSMHATQAGIILGTAAYMSPEQARGKTVDRRADIWAFGCVLFEMLTGARAFPGEDVTDTIVSVVSKEPDWTVLPSTVSPGVRRLLARCLTKDPKARLRDIGEARIELAKIASGELDPSLPLAPSNVLSPSDGRPATQHAFPWIVAAASAVALVAALVFWVPWRSAPPLQPVRFSFVPAAALSISTSGVDRVLAMSPDGTHLAYVAVDGSLVIRAIDQLEAAPIRGITGARAPFFSPDGQWIGFFDGAVALKKVSVTGGPAIPICKISSPPRGASWGPDDTIVFALADAATGLWSVPSAGGEPTVITKADPAQGERDHQRPSVLPGGQAVLFTITAAADRETMQVAVLDRKTGRRKTLVRGASQAEYVQPPGNARGEPGYLIYAAAGTLRAVRFDLKTLTVTSDALPVVDGVATATTGAAEYTISRNGTLAYVPGTLNGAGLARSLVWVDRQGREEVIQAPPRGYVIPRLAPDGTRLALDITDLVHDIWTWDLARQTLTRLTFDPASSEQPVWTPDSRRIIFASARAGAPNLFWRAADGTGADQRLSTSANAQFPNSVTPDGTYVLGYEVFPKTLSDVVQFALDGASFSRGTGAPTAAVQRPSEPLVQTTFLEINAEISPDGRYLAYQSRESGKDEIYVRPYPKVNDGRWQVSTGGGTRAVWARNGRELFYVDGANTLTAVPVQTTGSTFSPGNPAKVFDTKYVMLSNARNYDVSLNGQRFLMIKAGTTDDTATPVSVVVVEHWFEELKSKAPIK